MNEDKTVSILGTLRADSKSFFAMLSETGGLLEIHSFSPFNSSLNFRYRQLLKRENGYYAIGVANLTGNTLGNIVVASLDSLGNSACITEKLTTILVTDFTYTSNVELLAYKTRNVTPQLITYDGGTPFNPTADLKCNTTVSIKEHQNSQHHFTCFPNPVSNNISFDVELSEYTDLKIISILGETISHIKVEKVMNLLDVSSLASGTYLIELSNKNITTRSRFIKN